MSPRSRALLAGLAVTVLFCLPLLPEVLGTRRLIFRDAHVTHWPWRRVAMDSLAAGRVPFVNVSSSGGEPFLANPNAVLVYPTLLLEKVLAPAAAFNLHYLLHVLWAFFGARALARRLGLPGGPAFFSAVAFAFSGIMMSYGSGFANSVASRLLASLVRRGDSRSRPREGRSKDSARRRRLRDRLRAAASRGRAGSLSPDDPLRRLPRTSGDLLREKGSSRCDRESSCRRSTGRARRGRARLASPPAALRGVPPDLPGTAPLLRARVRRFPLPGLADGRVALSPVRRRPRGARRGCALAVRLSPGRGPVHLVRDVRRDSFRRHPDRGRATRLLDAPDDLARRRRLRLAPLFLRLLSPLLPPALLVPRHAPPAIPDQVLSADDALHGAPGGIRRPAAAPRGVPRRPAGGSHPARRRASLLRGLPHLLGGEGFRPGGRAAAVGFRTTGLGASPRYPPQPDGRRAFRTARDGGPRSRPLFQAPDPRPMPSARARHTAARPSLCAAPLRVGRRERPGPPTGPGRKVERARAASTFHWASPHSGQLARTRLCLPASSSSRECRSRSSSP